MQSSNGKDGLIPSFALSIFNDDEGLTLTVHTPEKPSVKKYASLALLYGLSLLILDREGILEQKIEQLQLQGPISEVDAVNQIAGLLKDDANELPI